MKTKLLILGVTFFLVSAFSFFTPFISDTVDRSSHFRHPWEKYDSSLLTQLQSVEDLINMADKLMPANQRHTLSYYDTINRLLERRFYHGYSHYTLQSNPFAYVAGELFWNHLSAIVISDDIMKHPMAACSQQSLVLMEVFRGQGVPFRRVGFDHHYAMEAFLNGQWYLFDSNMEPQFSKGRKPIQALVDSNEFYNSYKYAGMSRSDFEYQMGNLHYGKINETNASNATVFHQICLFINACSGVCFLATALLFIAVYKVPKHFGFRKKSWNLQSEV